MKDRLRPTLRTEPNMVPMIDIMLVLLIIFMIVTPVIANGFQAVMPQGDNISAKPDDERDIVLGIDKDGRYFLNGTPIASDTLSHRLSTIFNRRTTDKVMFLRADKNLAFAQIQDVVEIARHSGIRVMGMVTEKDQMLK